MKRLWAWLWENTLEPTLQVFFLLAVFLFVLGSVIGSMFGIAYIVDQYGVALAFLFIPWFMLIVTAFKRIDDTFDEIRRTEHF